MNATAVQAYEEGVEPQTKIPPATPEQAKEKTGIAVVLPRDLSISGNVKAIFPDTSAPGHPELCLHFDNGVLLTEEKWDSKPDFSKEIAQDSDPTYHEDPITPGSNWELVTIAGHEGKLLPQPATVGSDGRVHDLPPILEFWASGIRYRVSVWKKGITGKQLVDLANSML